MEGKMDSNDNKKVLDRRVYGNGTEFTEAGIRKYLFEKEVGLTHSFSKNEPKRRNYFLLNLSEGLIILLLEWLLEEFSSS